MYGNTGNFFVDGLGNTTLKSITCNSVNLGNAINTISGTINTISGTYQPRLTNLNNIYNNLTTTNAFINTFTPTDTPTWQISAGSVVSNAEAITNAWGYLENQAQKLTLNQGTGANQDISIQNISTTAYAGQTLIIKVWVKLGTATNFVLVLNNGSAWNTVGGQSFTSPTINSSTYTQISFSFTPPATNKVNIHVGCN